MDKQKISENKINKREFLKRSIVLGSTTGIYSSFVESNNVLAQCTSAYNPMTADLDARGFSVINAKSVIERVFNVRGFGAAGDGTADDYKAIQRAIDAAITGTGVAWILFPSGAYRITRPLVIPRGKITYLKISGTGKMSSFLVWDPPNPAGSVLTINAGQMWSLEDFGIDGNKKATKGLVLLSACNPPGSMADIFLKNLRIANCTVGVSGTPNIPAAGLQLGNQSEPNGCGIEVSNILVQNCTFYGNSNNVIFDSNPAELVTFQRTGFIAPNPGSITVRNVWFRNGAGRFTDCSFGVITGTPDPLFPNVSSASIVSQAQLYLQGCWFENGNNAKVIDSTISGGGLFGLTMIHCNLASPPDMDASGLSVFWGASTPCILIANAFIGSIKVWNQDTPIIDLGNRWYSGATLMRNVGGAGSPILSVSGNHIESGGMSPRTPKFGLWTGFNDITKADFAGSATIAAGKTSVTIVGNANVPDANYKVFVTNSSGIANYNPSISVNKAITAAGKPQFTIHVSVAPPSNANFDWFII